MLPKSVQEYLSNAAQSSRVKMPSEKESLFTAGVLDSFSLVDFVTFLENEFNIKVDDNKLRPENFDTMQKVEQFLVDAGVSV